MYHSIRRPGFILSWNSSGSVCGEIRRAFELQAWEDLVTCQIYFMAHGFKLALGILRVRAESSQIHGPVLSDSYHFHSWPSLKMVAWVLHYLNRLWWIISVLPSFSLWDDGAKDEAPIFLKKCFFSRIELALRWAGACCLWFCSAQLIWARHWGENRKEFPTYIIGAKSKTFITRTLYNCR